MSLSPEQIEDLYRRQGFAHPVNILSENEAAEHHVALCAFEREYGPMHYRVKPYLVFSPAYELATNSTLLDAVEAVLGPDILLWDSSYIIKEPDSEGFISWHQDLTYWGLESDSDDDLVSVWIALTTAHRENGCMQFVSGSHNEPRMPHHDSYAQNNLLHRGQNIDVQFDEPSIVHLEMTAGQCSLHHGWAVHSSNPNTSDERRVALAINYVRPSVRQKVSSGESATLVRGTDSFQHFVPEPECGADNVPENVRFQLEAERLKREIYDKA